MKQLSDKVTAIFITALVLALFAYASDGPEVSFTGHVSDSEGAVIQNARVLIHWDPAGSTVGLSDNKGIRQDLIVSTDRNGNFAAEIPPGFYDIFVTSMAFTPVAQKVRVKEDGNNHINLKMVPDPLVAAELGHDIATHPEQ